MQETCQHEPAVKAHHLPSSVTATLQLVEELQGKVTTVRSPDFPDLKLGPVEPSFPTE